MAKTAISLTIEQTNLLWLKGRARVVAGGSLSAAVDQLIAEARAGRLGQGDPPKSVVGTIDLPDEQVLAAGKELIAGLFAGSLSRPVFVHEDAPGYRRSKAAAKKKRRG
jgi:hypothetical protein